MSEVDTAALESALNGAFSNAPVEKPAPASQRQPEPDEVESLIDPESDPADLLEGAPETEEAPEAKAAEVPEDPEFELEIEPGKPETIPLSRMKELAARGAKAGRGFEENARVREALLAHGRQVQLNQEFHQAVSGDIASIQALEAQLQPFEKMDWSAAYDSDPFNAMKLKEQRDQLREQRAALIQGFQAKQQQFQAHVKETQQQVLAAESEALLAKVPVWRNPEKAAQEKGEISGALTSHYGFTQGEVAQIMDHRMLLVARDAAAYRKLLANKDAKVKQAREAPATAKPGAVAAQTNGRVEFNKVRGKLRELGTKGNHRAQENLATQLFERAFK